MKDKLNLLPVDRVGDISTEEFTNKYFIPHVPVVLRDFAKDWPALKKWKNHMLHVYLKQQGGTVAKPVKYSEYLVPSYAELSGSIN